MAVIAWQRNHSHPYFLSLEGFISCIFVVYLVLPIGLTPYYLVKHIENVCFKVYQEARGYIHKKINNDERKPEDFIPLVDDVERCQDKHRALFLRATGHLARVASSYCQPGGRIFTLYCIFMSVWASRCGLASTSNMYSGIYHQAIVFAIVTLGIYLFATVHPQTVMNVESLRS